MTLALFLAPVFAAAATAEEAHVMTDRPPALNLEVEARDGMLDVRLVGLSPQAVEVRYTLEVTGSSTSRHSGATTLTAGARAVLSTLRTTTAGEWCVKLEAAEAGRAPYTLTRGTCAGA